MFGVSECFKQWALYFRTHPPTEDDETTIRQEVISFGLRLEEALLSEKVPQETKDKYIAMMFKRHPDGIRWWYPGLHKK